MHLDVDGTRVTLDPKTGKLHLQVRSKLFPKGFKAKITHPDNQEALLSAITDKYASSPLPPLGVLMPLGDPDNIPLGIDAQGEVVSVPWHDTLPVISITGKVGAGKTVLANGITDWGLRSRHTVRLFTDRPSEYAALEKKYENTPSHAFLNSIATPSLFTHAAQELESRTIREKPKELWVIDAFDNFSQDAAMLESISKVARFHNLKIVVVHQMMRQIPLYLQGATRFIISMGEKEAERGVGKLLDSTGTRTSRLFRVGMPSLLL